MKCKLDITQRLNGKELDFVIYLTGMKTVKTTIFTDGKTPFKFKNLSGQDTETRYKWISSKVLQAKCVTLQDKRRNFTRKRYLDHSNKAIMVEEYKSPKGVVNKRYYYRKT